MPSEKINKLFWTACATLGSIELSRLWTGSHSDNLNNKFHSDENNKFQYEIINELAWNGKKVWLIRVQEKRFYQFSFRTHNAESNLTTFRELFRQTEVANITRRLCTKSSGTHRHGCLAGDLLRSRRNGTLKTLCGRWISTFESFTAECFTK